MRREVIFAILFGSILGTTLAFGIWKVNSSVVIKSPEATPLSLIATQATTAPTLAPVSTISDFLITSPRQTDLITTGSVIIAGQYKPNSTVIISADTKDYSAKASSNGSFTTSIEANAGINSILFTAFEPEKKQKEIKLAYSTEVATASSSAKPVAYIGRVTDKTDTGMQIQSDTNQILQATVSANTTKLVRLTSTPSKEIAFPDLAIGDFIAALGYEGKNAVLGTQRVLVTFPPNLDKRQVLKGNITKSNNQLALNADSQQYTLRTNNSTSFTKIDSTGAKAIKLADIADQANVIVVGKITDKTFEARSVFLLL